MVINIINMQTKKIILTGIIILGLVLVAWLVYGMINNGSGIFDESKNSDINIDEETGIENSNSKKEINDRNIKYNEAIASDDHTNCLSLDDLDMKNACIVELAINNSNIDLCQEIEEVDKFNYCKNRVYHEIAIENNNINNCALIEDNFWHKSCLNKVIMANDFEASVCDNINSFDDAKKCEDIVTFQKAIADNNCDLLTGDMKSECEVSLNINHNQESDNNQDSAVDDEEELKNLDSDGDGLSDYEEINIYGTDPENSDSDGDTYLDGEEVENGYDPLSS